MVVCAERLGRIGLPFPFLSHLAWVIWWLYHLVFDIVARRNFTSPTAIAKEPSWGDIQSASDFYDAHQRGVADSALNFP